MKAQPVNLHLLSFLGFLTVKFVHQKSCLMNIQEMGCKNVQFVTLTLKNSKLKLWWHFLLLTTSVPSAADFLTKLHKKPKFQINTIHKIFIVCLIESFVNFVKYTGLTFSIFVPFLMKKKKSNF